MSDYDNLDALIGKLKRAAIDARMREEFEDSSTTTFTIENDVYTIETTSSWTTPPTVHQHITRPGKNGQGGGKWSSTDPDTLPEVVKKRSKEFHQIFNEVRSEIDSILQGWTDLPGPEKFTGDIDDCRSLCASLARDASISDGVVVPGGTIDNKIATIIAYLEEMRGLTVYSYKTNFIDKFSDAIDAIHAVSVALGATLNAEKNLFEQARQSVADVIIEFTDSFNKAVKNIENEFDLSLKMGSLVLEGFTTFLGTFKLIKTTAGGLNYGIKVLSGLSDKSVKTEKMCDYDGNMTGLRRIFEEMNRDVKKCENKIKQNANDNCDAVHKEKAIFDFTLDPIESKEIDNELNSGNKLIIDQITVDEIVHLYMPAVIVELHEAAKRVPPISMTCAERDERIGIGASGPSTAFYALKWKIHKIINDLIWDAENITKNFELAIAYLQEQDVAIKAEIDALSNKIQNENKN